MTEFGRNLEGNEFLVTVPEPRKVSEARPLFATTLVNLHAHDRGSVCIPCHTMSDDLLSGQDANIAESAWRALREQYGLSGDRQGKPAHQLVGQLIRTALAVLHSPAYQDEHKSALSADWARFPIPKDDSLLAKLGMFGDQVAQLLDANNDATSVVDDVLGEDCAASHLGNLG